MFNVNVLLDFFSSLAMLSLLAWSYGWVRRTARSEGLTHLLLGTLFGAITFLQMNSPLEVMPGLIFDLRHVPVLLAGAYLGWRGALPCIAIAIAARISIGGVGMEVGVMGLLIAGIIGLGWHEAMSNRASRGPLALAMLGVIGASRFVLLLLLPPETASFLFFNLMPILIVMDVVGIVIIGSLMERECAVVEGERLLRAAASYDPGSGLMTREGLERAHDHIGADAAPAAGMGLVLIRLRNRDWILREHGQDGLDRVLGALRHRLERELPRYDLVSLTRTGDIAILLTDRDARSQEVLVDGLMRGLTLRPVRVNGDAEVRVTVELGQTWDLRRRPLAVQFEEAGASLDHNTRLGTTALTGTMQRGPMTDILFDRAQRLLN